MERPIEDLSPQELMDYMNRVIHKHTETAKERTSYIAGSAKRIALTERMEALERLFYKARLLSEHKGYVTFH